jgi:Rod binding domain-containing protein
VKVTVGVQPVDAPRAEPTPEQARLTHAARQFEAVMLRRMLSALEKTTQVQSSKSASMYGTMIVDAMADAIVGAGGLGMAKILEQSLPGQKPKDGA